MFAFFATAGHGGFMFSLWSAVTPSSFPTELLYFSVLYSFILHTWLSTSMWIPPSYPPLLHLWFCLTFWNVFMCPHQLCQHPFQGDLALPRADVIHKSIGNHAFLAKSAPRCCKALWSSQVSSDCLTSPALERRRSHLSGSGIRTEYISSFVTRIGLYLTLGEVHRRGWEEEEPEKCICPCVIWAESEARGGFQTQTIVTISYGPSVCFSKSRDLQIWSDHFCCHKGKTKVLYFKKEQPTLGSVSHCS